MALGVSLWATSCVVLAVCAFLEDEDWHRRALALLALPLGACALLLRTHIEGGSAEGAFRAMALLNGIVLLVTAGRPSRMFDLPTVNGGDDGVPIHDSAVEERTATRVARSQVLFLGVVCFGVLVYELFGWTFLD